MKDPMKRSPIKLGIAVFACGFVLTSLTYYLHSLANKTTENVNSHNELIAGGSLPLVQERDPPPKTWAEKYGWTPADYFTDPVVISLCREIENQDIVKAQELIDSGCDVNTTGRNNMTPLLWAYGTQNEELFRLLLDLGADPNVVFDWKAEDYFEDTLLVASCHAIEENDLEEIEILLADGVDPNAFGRDDMSLFRWARIHYKSDVLRLFSERGYDPSHSSVIALFDSRSSIERKDSIVWLCANNRNSVFLRHVLECGGDPNFSNRFETPVIFPAISRGSMEHVKLLVDAGADINSRYVSNRETPMIYAVGWGRYDIAIYLLEIGADHTILENDYTDLALTIVRRDERLTESGQRLREQLIALLEAKGVDFRAAEEEIALRLKEKEEINFPEHPLWNQMFEDWRERAKEPAWLP